MLRARLCARLCAPPGEGFGIIHPRNDWDNTIAAPWYSMVLHATPWFTHITSDNQLKLWNGLTQSDGSGGLGSVPCYDSLLPSFTCSITPGKGQSSVCEK